MRRRTSSASTPGSGLLKPGLDLDLYAFGSGLHARRTSRSWPPMPNSPLYKKEAAAQGTFGARIKQRSSGSIIVRGGLQAGSRPGTEPTIAPGRCAARQQAEGGRRTAYHIDAEVGLNLARTSYA